MRRMIGFLMMVGLVTGVGCGDDDSSPTSSSVSQDKYSETIVGTWNYFGEQFWTFSSDETVEFADWEDFTFYWAISGSTLTITDSDGDLWGEYPLEIKSMSSTELVYVSKIDKVDGSGTVEEEVTQNR